MVIGKFQPEFFSFHTPKLGTKYQNIRNCELNFYL